METEDDNNEEDDSGTALAIAAVAGGAVLLWLLLGRGGGRGRGRSGDDGGIGPGDGRAGAPRDEQMPSDRLPVSIYLKGSDERIEVNGIVTDLRTAIALAKASGKACLANDGAVRHGFIVEVRDALQKAGVFIGTTKNVYNDKRERIARSGDSDCLRSPTFGKFLDAYSAQYPEADLSVVHGSVDDVLLQLHLQHALSK